MAPQNALADGEHAPYSIHSASLDSVHSRFRYNSLTHFGLTGGNYCAPKFFER